MPAIPAICIVVPSIAPLSLFPALDIVPAIFCLTLTVAVYTLPLKVFSSLLIFWTLEVASSFASILTLILLPVRFNLDNSLSAFLVAFAIP